MLYLKKITINLFIFQEMQESFDELRYRVHGICVEKIGVAEGKEDKIF